MTRLPSPQPSGKRPGKQIRGGLGLWGSKRTHSAETTYSEFARSTETVICDGFGAITMPEAAAGPLQHAFCCFPCFPGFVEPVGEAKNGPEGPF
jgi:hypothetical protein